MGLGELALHPLSMNEDHPRTLRNEGNGGELDLKEFQAACPEFLLWILGLEAEDTAEEDNDGMGKTPRSRLAKDLVVGAAANRVGSPTRGKLTKVKLAAYRTSDASPPQ
eukprot:gnl/TRDRNA2_/TRDRNA2_41054_c0_seq1.p1 gnl/TRDRNA2_/TRDRNA2_41054_c0~~gnl/TRDRNA2_/TRDRNA2_41054_c0_seq1.p1  ORF type:complete len:125 (+),score=21.19 gnl/TRDRNA2_/TRDRNA2_41054_c0_seq1:49-375(+)